MSDYLNAVPEYGANPDYPYYVKGVTNVPPDVPTPIDGYRNMELNALVAGSIAEYLESQDIDPTLARETVVSIVPQVNAVFENQFAEYRIAGLMDTKRHSDEGQRLAKFDRLIKELQSDVLRALIRAIGDSSLSERGDSFERQLCIQATKDLGEYIGSINDKAADKA
jgi:hypothetical protein